MDEAGNPIYHQAEISDTLDALLDGSLTLEENSCFFTRISSRNDARSPPDAFSIRDSDLDISLRL